MKRIKHISLLIAEKSILTFEFLWATWWTLLGIIAGLYGFYKLCVTGDLKYLFSFPIIFVSGWQMVKEWKEWKEYKKKYKTDKT